MGAMNLLLLSRGLVIPHALDEHIKHQTPSTTTNTRTELAKLKDKCRQTLSFHMYTYTSLAALLLCCVAKAPPDRAGRRPASARATAAAAAPPPPFAAAPTPPAARRPP